MITIPLQIRPSDHDSLGHINNATYVAYVQHAVAELLARQGFVSDWQGSGSYAWTMQDLAVEYRLASSFGDQIAARVWLAEVEEGWPTFGCDIMRSDGNDEQVAIRSSSRWQRQDSKTGEAARLPPAFLITAEGGSESLLRPLKIPAIAGEVRRYHWRHVVERTEVGLAGKIHPHVLFRWIEESILSASAEAGWPIERYLASDFIVFQMRHDASFHSRPAMGEVMEITSRLVNVRRLRGTWQNEIKSLDDGRSIATNYSTGVFLNLAGRPTSPPAGMIEALQQPIS
jgi:acyl-CoA thioester hydrolase